ncbi:MAG: TonB-dependent receptor [Bacteroidetes bacterium]|nr:TonB-dependent receptor [Bacteroidota bacterium]
MNRRIFPAAFYAIIFLFGIVVYSFADTSGKLTGTISGSTTKEALIGVNVVLQGTSIGAATDFDGYFVIINIPPGTYDVRISSIGYGTKLIKGVRINSGQTTTLNETLAEETIETKEVVITAERPIVDTRQTSAVKIMGEDQISVLPVQNLQDIVNLQAGVVDGHFRGGRTGEVQYQVDGVSINNPLTNNPAVSLDRSVLQEVQVISGTFDAEYGQAMSGVVNAVLRSGRKDAYEWNAEVYVGDNVTFGSDPNFPYIERINPLAYQSYQFSVSGPIGLPQTTFLFNARRYASEGYLFGRRMFMPTDTNDFSTKSFHPTGDGKLVPLATQDEWSGQFKVSNSSLEAFQLSYQAIFNLTNNKPYNFAFRLEPDGVAVPRFFSLVHGIDVTQMLTDKLFYTINLRQNKVDYRNYKYQSIYDPRYYQAKQPRGDADYEYGAIVQGVELGRYIENTNVYIAKLSVTDQATNNHLLKFGAEIQLNTIKYGNDGVIDRDSITGALHPYVNSTLFPQARTYTPTSLAVYGQDRIEWKDVMVRAGLRMEYFDANTTIPGDLRNPANNIIGIPATPAKKTTPKLVFAPRLGISYPIIVNGSIYFSYGHFYQLPAINTFFSNSDYSILRELSGDGVGRYGVLGNPDINPEFTTQYEFGMKAALTENFGIDGSLFYKDIRDLLGVEFIETYNSARYARLTNVDFGSVRGFTLSLDFRTGDLFSASVDYTNQYASGNSSSPEETAVRAAAGKDANPRETPFDWDQRHTLNGQVTLQEAGNYSVTAIVRYGSGQPYTPTIGSGFGADLENNMGRKAAGTIVDLRSEKDVEVAGIKFTAFLRIFNLFNASFFNGFIFSSTGSPYYSLNPVGDRVSLIDPNRFFQPRRVEIGISIHGFSKVQ